jgi:hypothetical protein
MLRLIQLITGTMPDLKSYTIKPPETKKRAAGAPSAKSPVGKDQEVIAGRVWTKTKDAYLPKNVDIEYTVNGSSEGLSLDQLDIDFLAQRFGSTDAGVLKADVPQAMQIKSYRSAGRSIDDVVNAHKGQSGWSRANIAKFYGAFREAEAERRSKTV